MLTRSGGPKGDALVNLNYPREFLKPLAIFKRFQRALTVLKTEPLVKDLIAANNRAYCQKVMEQFSTQRVSFCFGMKGM